MCFSIRLKDQGSEKIRNENEMLVPARYINLKPAHGTEQLGLVVEAVLG